MRRTMWRGNVLALIGAGYLVVLAVFIGLVVAGCPVGDAAEIVTAPLMALIGGSLAISKDLIAADDSGKGADYPVDHEEHQRPQESDSVEPE